MLWTKFDQFTPGSNFFAWACKIARYEVARFRRQKHRGQEVCSDQFADVVAHTAEEMSDELESRQRALVGCVQKLSEGDRDLLRLRYVDGAAGADVAASVGRSIHAVYKAFKRIRRTLYNCVQSQIRKEASR